MTRAVVATGYGEPDVLRVVEVDPGRPGPGHLLLGVRAAGVNPADWKQYSGAWGTDPEALPIRLGHEAAGEVLAIGPGVDDVSPGDHVLAQPVRGAYADQVVVKASALVRKPPAMEWETAAGLLVAGTAAAHALSATGVGPGDTVLVHGASGGVGSLAVQLATGLGARVVGTASPRHHDDLAALGAVPVAYGPGLADRVRDAAPQGVDAAVDTAGTDEALQTSVDLVADRTRVATLAGFDLGARLGVRLLGGGAGADPGTAVRRQARHDLVRLWADGRISVRIGARYPLDDAAAAHRAGRSGRVHGKIVLLP